MLTTFISIERVRFGDMEAAPPLSRPPFDLTIL